MYQSSELVILNVLKADAFKRLRNNPHPNSMQERAIQLLGNAMTHLQNRGVR
jgi:hypothetical protein